MMRALGILLAAVLLAAPGLGWRFGGNTGGGGGSSPVVATATFTASEPALTSQVIGQASATNSPTSWTILSCAGCVGYFAVDNAGNITVTSTGAASITANNTPNVTTFSPVVQATNGSGSNSATQTINFYADGFTAAPVGTAPFPSLLNTYHATGGDGRFPGNGRQPVWKVAGVDYRVGVPAGATLNSPTTLSNPNISVNSGSHQVTVTGNNTTITNIDFSLNGGWQVILSSATNVTIQNSNFAVGTNAQPMLNGDIGSTNNNTILYSTFNAQGLADGLNNTNINIKGNITIEYCLIENASSDLFDQGGSGATAQNILLQFNAFYNSGQLAGSHPDWVQLGGGTYTVTVLYNTWFQPAVVAGPGTQGVFVDAGNNGASVTGANTIANNVMVAAASSQVNYFIGALATVGGGNTFLISSNYYDPTGIGNAIYKYSSAQNTQTGNINMTNGAAAN